MKYIHTQPVINWKNIFLSCLNDIFTNTLEFTLPPSHAILKRKIKIENAKIYIKKMELLKILWSMFVFLLQLRTKKKVKWKVFVCNKCDDNAWKLDIKYSWVLNAYLILICNTKIYGFWVPFSNVYFFSFLV